MVNRTVHKTDLYYCCDCVEWCVNRSPTGLFTIEWLDDGSVGIKGSNGRYVTARMNGSLYAVSDSLADRERFIMTIVNRPLLVLRCDYGFVGFRTPNNSRYECNKAYYDVIYVEQSNGPAYYLKGSPRPLIIQDCKNAIYCKIVKAVLLPPLGCIVITRQFVGWFRDWRLNFNLRFFCSQDPSTTMLRPFLIPYAAAAARCIWLYRQIMHWKAATS